MQLWGSIYVTFLIFFMISSYLIYYGIKIITRGFLLPWIIQMGIIISFQFLWGIWQLYGYYIYVSLSNSFHEQSSLMKTLYSSFKHSIVSWTGYGWDSMWVYWIIKLKLWINGFFLFQIYCWMVVVSQYQIFLKEQNPNIELLMPWIIN